MASLVTKAAVAASIIGGVFAGLSPAAAAHTYKHRSHIRPVLPGDAYWTVRPHGEPYVLAYGAPRRNDSDYYFTGSSFCPPSPANGYDGGFSMPAYSANGRFGYVCN